MDASLMMSQVTGCLLLIGTMVLLFFRRIVLDKQTKAVTSFKLPLVGEIKTQAPVLVLVFVGAAMVMYPLTQVVASTVTVNGSVDPGGGSVAVVVFADPDYAHSYDAATPFTFRVPLLKSQATYRVKFIVNRQVIDDQPVDVRNGIATLDPVSYTPKIPDPATKIEPKKDISDEELKQLGIGG